MVKVPVVRSAVSSIRQVSKRVRNCKVINARFQTGLPQVLKEKSVRVCITSPPYKEEDGFSVQMMEELSELLDVYMADTSLFFMNFGHLARDKGQPFRCADVIAKHFDWIETITWVKIQWSPVAKKVKTRLDNKTEFVFMFGRGDYELDRDAIGIEYIDKSNIGRYSNQDVHCAGNFWLVFDDVWFMKYQTVQKRSQKRHEARFPRELPRKCLKLSAPILKDKDIVLDPFLGSGTTLKVVAEEFPDLCGVGAEMLKGHYDRSIEWLKEKGS